VQQFFPIFGYRLLISSQAGVGEAEMIVAKRNAWIEPQRRLKLRYCLQRAIGILIGPT
jgi:hypothetical protein